MPNSNMESVDAIAEHLVTVSLGVITMRNDGIYTQKQSEELLDKYQANATAALERREERIKENKWHEDLENLAGRGYITFEQKDNLWDRDWPPIKVEPSQLKTLDGQSL